MQATGRHEGTLNGKSLFVKTRVQCRLVCSLLSPTYRCNRSQDPNGARIHDTRNDGCIVEMLGKKKRIGCTIFGAGFKRRFFCGLFLVVKLRKPCFFFQDVFFQVCKICANVESKVGWSSES